MKKVTLGLLLALLFSNISFANEGDEVGFTLKGLKPFVGVMVGTTTQSGIASSTNTYGYTYLPLFQSGLWGGFEYNLNQFAIRGYGNLLTSLIGSISDIDGSVSTTRMIFSGNIDLIYRPTQVIGVFIGFGLGDTMLGETSRNVSNTTTTTENYFTTMGNFGVQYNIDSHSLLELSAIMNLMWRFSATSTNGTTNPLFAPAISVSYSIMAKYAYRF